MKKITKWLGVFLLASMVPYVHAAGIVFSFNDNITPERQAALQAAANELQQIFHFRQDVKISVSFSALTCDNSSAILGFAGPQTAYVNFPGAPQNNVWYVAAQAADLGSTTAINDTVHIAAQFNNNLGNSGCLAGTTWYYGTDHNPGSNQVDFLGTAVHEMMHGLGFLSLVSSSGALNSGFIDNFSSFLMDSSTGKSWKDMTSAERKTSIRNTGNLVWNGAKTTAMDSLLSAGLTDGKVRLYAPSTYQTGSSTSHFDVAVHYSVGADEVMEPYDAFPQESIMASAAFCDMGWQLLRDTDGDGINDCDDSDPLVSDVDSDGDGVPDALDAFPHNAAAAVDTDGDGKPDAWLPNNPYGCAPDAPTCNGLTLDDDNDNDGVPNATDNCPLVWNPDQKDYNHNGLGDACDPLPMPGVSGEIANDKAGTFVAFVGDIDHDGYGDYAVGTPGYDLPAAPPLKAIKDAGKVDIISGRTGLPLVTVRGTKTKGGLGLSIAGNADINGDGIPDVVVGEPLADNPIAGAKNVGAVYVIYGSDHGDFVQETVYGTEPKALFGAALAVGKVDGDSRADVVVGAPNAVNAQGAKRLVQAGKVQVLSGANLQTVPLRTIYGATARAHAGAAVAAGDFDGAPGAEIIVGAPDDDNATSKLLDVGSVAVYTLSGDPIYKQYGSVAKGHFGAALAAGVDVNADGAGDVLVGAPGAFDVLNPPVKHAGAVSILYGSSTGNYSESAPLFGSTANAALGTSVAWGDVKGNGHPAIIAGAPGDHSATAGAKGEGSVHVWNGQSFNVISVQYGAAASDLFGASVGAGDIDGDGKADLIIGIPRKDILSGKLQKDAGKVVLVSGAQL